MSERGDRNDSAPRRGLLDLGQQKQGQEEVSDVVALELALVAVLGDLLGAHHNPGVVDQQVDFTLVLEQPLGALPHARQAGQV